MNLKDPLIEFDRLIENDELEKASTAYSRLSSDLETLPDHEKKLHYPVINRAYQRLRIRLHLSRAKVLLKKDKVKAIHEYLRLKRFGQTVAREIISEVSSDIAALEKMLILSSARLVGVLIILALLVFSILLGLKAYSISRENSLVNYLSTVSSDEIWLRYKDECSDFKVSRQEIYTSRCSPALLYSAYTITPDKQEKDRIAGLAQEYIDHSKAWADHMIYSALILESEGRLSQSDSDTITLILFDNITVFSQEDWRSDRPLHVQFLKEVRDIPDASSLLAAEGINGTKVSEAICRSPDGTKADDGFC